MIENILPMPFSWVTIPAGKVRLITHDRAEPNYVPKGADGAIADVPVFQIGRYAITNAQFRLFVDAGGYSNDTWWTLWGRIHRKQENWMQPRFWGEPDWDGDNQPVMGISWYEAVAFCQWLSEVSGENITLPTEQQWQRAAQGDDDRLYPWGNEWDNQRCNNSDDEHSIGKTTPVTQYEGVGDSPYGVVGMAGNVWEFCTTIYDTGETHLHGTDKERRVLRGGGWSVGNIRLLQTTHRYWGSPYLHGDWGFRIVRQL